MAKPVLNTLVLFDGVCALCNRVVQFLVAIDRHQILNFAYLQGKTASSIMKRHPMIKHSPQSVIFVLNYGHVDETIFFRSEAIFNILNTVGGIWRVVAWLKFVPLMIRDPIYNWIAKKRYTWFGKDETCPLPKPEWRERFLP
ncbi:MAG: thiol-disulfide oxidoreductase DCC family protein [bacterium]